MKTSVTFERYKGKIPIVLLVLAYAIYLIWTATHGKWSPWNFALFPFAWLAVMVYLFFLTGFICTKTMGICRFYKYEWIIYSVEVIVGSILAVLKLKYMG